MTSLSWSEALVILLLMGSMHLRLMGQLARARRGEGTVRGAALDLLRW